MWCAHYEAHILLFVRTTLILSYCSSLALRGSANDKTPVWAIALTEYVFMAFTMFLTNARDGACPWYYTLNKQCDNLSAGVLFRLSIKIRTYSSTSACKGLCFIWTPTRFGQVGNILMFVIRSVEESATRRACVILFQACRGTRSGGGGFVEQ